jgi:hypothetical protein
MSYTIERMRQEYIKALVGRHVVQRRRQIETADMTEAEPEKPLLDVPLHQRGFGIMDEDMPERPPGAGQRDRGCRD